MRDANGAITGLGSVLLSIDSGSLSFDGAAGNGSSTAAGLDQATTSSGSLDLTF